MTGHHDDLDPDHDDDELFLALGHAVAAGASLEWAIVELHSTLLHSPRGLIAIASEGVERARAGCLELAAIIGPPVDTLVREALSPVREVWLQRNVLVHGAWVAGSHLGDPSRSGITIRLRRSGVSTDGWSVSSISTLMDELGRCADHITALDRRLQKEPEFVHLLARDLPPFQLGPAKIW